MDLAAELGKLSTEDHFKHKAKAVAVVLLEELWDLVKGSPTQNPTASVSNKFDLLKLSAKFGDLEPKQMVLPQGTGFSIKIVLSGDQSGPVPMGTVTIDQEPELPEPPAYLSLRPTPTAVRISSLGAT
jgi:hypothetical protein